MKRSKEETRNYDETISVSEEDYPYGLQINLDKEGLEKLGLSAEDFSIGGKVNMICQAKITGLSESAGMDGDYSNVSSKSPIWLYSSFRKVKNSGMFSAP